MESSSLGQARGTIVYPNVASTFDVLIEMLAQLHSSSRSIRFTDERNYARAQRPVRSRILGLLS